MVEAGAGASASANFRCQCWVPGQPGDFRFRRRCRLLGPAAAGFRRLPFTSGASADCWAFGAAADFRRLSRLLGPAAADFRRLSLSLPAPVPIAGRPGRSRLPAPVPAPVPMAGLPGPQPTSASGASAGSRGSQATSASGAIADCWGRPQPTSASGASADGWAPGAAADFRFRRLSRLLGARGPQPTSGLKVIAAGQSQRRVAFDPEEEDQELGGDGQESLEITAISFCRTSCAMGNSSL